MKSLKNNIVILFTIFIFVISSCKKEYIPTLSTSVVTNITGTSATSGGAITDEGSGTIIAKGVCWSTGTTPTITDNKTIDGSGAGSFASNLTNLSGGTSYFIRAYATNDVGTGYGMALSFNTLGELPLPTSTDATNINATTATLNGSVNANYLSTTVTFEYGTTSSYGTSITALQGAITGNSNTNVSADVLGLTASTIYHYRLKAVNSLGTTYSNDATFTTLGKAPTISTQAASNLTTTSASLNGTVNPNYLSTIVSFEYGLTTSYGSTINATQSPVSGSANTSVSSEISSLAAATTYHFRVKAVNSLGTTYGSDMTLTTMGQVPAASTQAASSLTITSASLNGTVNPNYLSTDISFEYGLTTSYGSTITATQNPISGSISIIVSAEITSLTVATTYHFRVKAVNSLGTTYGSDMTFTTKGQVPAATTQAVSSLTTTSASLNGTVNPNYLSTVVTFEYGLTTSYGSTINSTLSPVSGSTNTDVSAGISSLPIATTYHFRIKAVNSLGTTYGNDMTFTTLGQVPSATTQAASSLTTTSASLNGTVNPNYLSTNVSFEYGLTTSYGSTINSTQSPLSGSTNTNVSANISSLPIATSYHYRVKAVNTLGTTYGNDMTFTTLGQVPSSTTQAASNLTTTSASLNGTVNPNYLSTVVSFEYGLTASYGSTISSTQSPMLGSTNMGVSAVISNLLPGTTYHFRVKATNELGTTYGNDLTFITLILDIDGNVYNYTAIGTQVWMAENLKTTKYNDGTQIPYLPDPGNVIWYNLTTDAYCWFMNDPVTYKNTFGAIYNGYTINTSHQICPEGWHVPDDIEWTTLITFLGGEYIADDKISNWTANHIAGTVQVGFNAISAGIRFTSFESGGASWWSSSNIESNPNSAWIRRLSAFNSNIMKESREKRYGLSVRCIKD